MYEGFYKTAATPFTWGIPSDALYLPPELSEVENRLKYVAKKTAVCSAYRGLWN